jgi:hypothetical protein
MAHNFLRGDRDQPFLLPPDLRDWLPDGHLAWFILDVVDQLDLQPFYRAYRDDGHGHPAYDPKLLLGVLLYAYCVGVRSSRQIERRLNEDLAFRVLAANQAPRPRDHRALPCSQSASPAGFLVASWAIRAARRPASRRQVSASRASWSRSLPRSVRSHPHPLLHQQG